MMTWKLECQTCANANFYCYGMSFCCNRKDCQYEPFETVATSTTQLAKLQQTVSNKLEVE